VDEGELDEGKRFIIKNFGAFINVVMKP